MGFKGNMVWASEMYDGSYPTCVEGSKADVDKWATTNNGNNGSPWQVDPTWTADGCLGQGFTVFKQPKALGWSWGSEHMNGAKGSKWLTDVAGLKVFTRPRTSTN